MRIDHRALEAELLDCALELLRAAGGSCGATCARPAKRSGYLRIASAAMSLLAAARLFAVGASNTCTPGAVCSSKLHVDAARIHVGETCLAEIE
jgi:hypothetical protein